MTHKNPELRASSVVSDGGELISASHTLAELLDR
jgi:hypothetical protein